MELKKVVLPASVCYTKSLPAMNLHNDEDEDEHDDDDDGDNGDDGDDKMLPTIVHQCESSCVRSYTWMLIGLAVWHQSGGSLLAQVFQRRKHHVGHFEVTKITNA